MGRYWQERGARGDPDSSVGVRALACIQAEEVVEEAVVGTTPKHKQLEPHVSSSVVGAAGRDLTTHLGYG